LKTKIRDFLGRGVNLSVVISVDFLSQDLLGWFDIGDVFSDTSSNQMVLEPTIRSFHFPFGLRGKGIGDLHIAVIQNLFPLRGSFIGEQVMFSPERVPSLYESKNTMGVYIVSIRESVAEDNGLKS
jgi:hypothetical protein